MIIVNAEKDEAINLDYVRNIFITSQGEIKAATDFSRGAVLGKYSNIEEAQQAFIAMLSLIDGSLIVKMPGPEQVRARATATRQHSKTGSVQKSHGGS